MSFVIEDVLVRNDPTGGKLPVLFDSPHSGTKYPSDFDFICPLPVLRQAEDTYVDELFASAPDCGATLLAALFPRSYIDANRAADDIDPDIIEGFWPEPLNPTQRSMGGVGLIRWMCRSDMPMYDGRLPVDTIFQRINHYYRPYHFQVATTLDAYKARFGSAWHINCHSMPSTAQHGAPHAQMPDFVIGDLQGTSADHGFVAFVADCLGAMGYSVALNDPYKGVELVERYANPARGRHSVQIEVNRSLYMDEDTLTKTANFATLQRDLSALSKEICVYARDRLARMAAE